MPVRFSRSNDDDSNRSVVESDAARPNLIWIGAGAVAAFCIVVVAGILIISHIRGGAGPVDTAVRSKTETPAPSPPATSSEPAPSKSPATESPADEPELVFKPVALHVKQASLSVPARTFAYDPQSAHLAIWRNGGLEFFEIGAQPKSLGTAKPSLKFDSQVALRQHGERRYFVSTGGEPRAVYFIDADTLAVTQSVVSDTFPIGELIVDSFPSSSAVYFRTTVKGEPEGLACIQMGTWAIDPSSFIPNVSRFAAHVLPLPDGKGYLDYARHLQSRNSVVQVSGRHPDYIPPPSLIEVKSITPTDPPLTNSERALSANPRTSRDIESSFRGRPPLPASWVPLPFGDYVVLADVFFTAYEQRLEGKLPFKAMCHWPDSSWVFGYADGALAAASLNRLKEVKRIDLAWTGDEPQAVFADVPHKRLIVCGATRIMTVSMSAFGLPAEPILFAPRMPKPIAQVGQTFDLDLKPLSPGVELKLGKGPPGMSLNRTRLNWQPKLSDCGVHAIEVEYRHGDLSRSEHWTIKVWPRFVPVPHVARFSVSANGWHAVAWGVNPESKPPKPTLTLIDLESMSVVARREFDTPVQDAEVGNSGVYVCAGKSLLRLSLDDLTELAKKSVLEYGTASVDRVYLIADRFASVPGAGWELELPSLEPVKRPSLEGWPMTPAVAGRLHGGWVWDGVLWDGDLEEPKLLIGPSAIHGMKPKSTGAPVGRDRLKRAFDRFEVAPIHLHGGEAGVLDIARIAHSEE